MSNLKVDLNDAELAIQKALGKRGYGVNLLFQTWHDGWLIHTYDEDGLHQQTVGAGSLYDAIERLPLKNQN